MDKKELNGITFCYGRVSSAGQSLERQIEIFKELNIDERYWYLDKKSGKTFDREQYQILKKVLRKGDQLVIVSIDRLGRNYQMILDEWRDITKRIGCDIKVIDQPLLDTTQYKDALGSFVNDLIISILSFNAEAEVRKINANQKKGIECALKYGTKSGRPFGRPKISKPDNFEEVIKKWKDKEITAREAMKLLNLKPNTFYSMVKGEDL